MTGPLRPLASFFVSPPVVAAGTILPAEGESSAGARGQRRTRPARGRPPRHPDFGRPQRVAGTAVVGDAGAAAFAVDLAVVLAGQDRARCAVVAVWGATGAPPRGQATRPAAAVAGRLATTGCASIAAAGRSVVATLPDDAAVARDVFDAIPAAVGEGACIVLAICGPRPAALDDALARSGRVVLVVGADAPTALAGAAAASVGQTAPAARIVPVTLGTGTALPRPLRHRAAIRRALEEEQP